MDADTRKALRLAQESTKKLMDVTENPHLVKHLKRHYLFLLRLEKVLKTKGDRK